MESDDRNEDFKPAKVIIEVVSGVIPGTPMVTKRWALTREEYQDTDVYFRTLGEANMHALAMMEPSSTNWVRLEWIWL